MEIGSTTFSAETVTGKKKSVQVGPARDLPMMAVTRMEAVFTVESIFLAVVSLVLCEIGCKERYQGKGKMREKNFL